MPALSLEQLFDTALSLQAGGHLVDAHENCQEILKQDPNHAPAWHLEGLLQTMAGDFRKAAPLFERAIACQGDVAEYYHSLSRCYQAMGRTVDAMQAMRRAIQLRPNYAEALLALGALLLSQGQIADAADSFRRAITVSPDDARGFEGFGKALGLGGDLVGAAAAFATAIELEPWNTSHWLNLGLAYERQGNLDGAIVNYQRSVRIRPDDPIAWNQLGNVLRTVGRVPEAVAALQQAVNRTPPQRPEFAEIQNNYAIALSVIGRNKEAAAAAEAAIASRPNYIQGRANYARILQNSNRHTDAIEQLRLVIAARPNDADVHNNLGNSLHVLGHVDEAINEYRAALKLRPEDAAASSNLLYALQFTPTTTADAIQHEHEQWRDIFERPAASRRRKHANSRDPNRCLRIGYVSADLREHAAGFFIEPILANHDHGRFEVFCYSDAVQTDAVTTRLRRGADRWVESHRLSDDQLAEKITEDRIDLLIDLSVHTRGNRLRAFALKPAPVQLSYLGYCGTTGVEAIDYRITDEVVDPPGLNERWSTEKLLRLPRTFCCFAPSPLAPSVGPLPAQANHHITFGAFNSLPKTTSAMIELWCRILQAAPGAKLMMRRHAIDEEPVRQELLARFAFHGIGPDRLNLSGGVGLREFFDVLNRVDISLDTFPFNGHATTCQALWMGVPTVSLAGEPPVSRAGASLLRHVGLQRLATSSAEDYVKAAVDLASHAGELSVLRKSLRKRMEKSPLCDATTFVADLEGAYRTVWTHWCESH